MNATLTEPTVWPAPAAPAPRNPFVGPRSLRLGEPIFGRSREIDDTKALIQSRRLALLYSPSGAGKTSLLEAGLVPELREAGFLVMPTIRVSHEFDSESSSDSSNRYVLSVIASLEEGIRPEHWIDQSDPAACDLGQYLSRLCDHAGDRRLCLIFDQFEELFVVNPADAEAKREFVEVLGRALSDRRLWALFAMREDFIAQLDPYLPLFPTRLRAHLRLDFLAREPAIDAVRETAKLTDTTFDPGVLEHLVDDLRRIQVEHRDEVVTEAGPHVEPLHLQVVCRRLWDHESRRVQQSHVDAMGGVDQALAAYYADAIEGACETTGVNELDLREWVDEELITDDGFRRQTRRGPGNQGDRVLEALADAYLIRGDRRRGTFWYELTHDRFVAPIQAENDAYHALRATRRRRFFAGLALLLLAFAIAAGVILFATRSTDPLTADDLAIPTPDGGKAVVLAPDDDPRRFIVTPEEGNVLVIELMVADASVGSTAELRLMGVLSNGELGEELAADHAGRDDIAIAEADREDTGDPDGPEVGSRVFSIEVVDPVATIRYAVLESDTDLVIEVASDTGGEFVLDIGSERSETIKLDPAGGPKAGSIGAAGEAILFEFDAEAGQRMVVGASPLSSDVESLDVVIKLLDPDGETLSTADAGGAGRGESLAVAIETTGIHNVEVSGYADTFGEFEVAVTAFEPRSIVLDGAAVSGSATPGEPSMFVLDLAEGDEIVVIARPHPGSSFDPAVTLWGPGGSVLGGLDLHLDGGPEYVPARVDADGELIIEVATLAENVGQFEVSAVRAETVGLDHGGRLEGRLGEDVVPVQAVVADERTHASDVITVTPSADADVVVVLSTPDGTFYVDDVGIGQREVFDLGIFALGTGDRWLVSAQLGFGDGEGTYTMSRRSLEPTRLTADGDTVSGSIDRVGATVDLEVELSVDETVRFEVDPLSQELEADLRELTLVLRDADLFLVAASGFVLGEAGNELVAKVPETGTYYLEVGETGTSTGQFEVSASPVSVRSIRLGEAPVDGAVAGADGAAAFTIAAIAGSPMTIEVVPDSGLDAVVSAFGPDGLHVGRDVGGEGAAEVTTIMPAEDGVHTISVSGFQGSTGPFTISVSEPSPVLLGAGDRIRGSISPSNPAVIYEVDPERPPASIAVDTGRTFEAVIEIVTPWGNDLVWVEQEDGLIEYDTSWLAPSLPNERVLVVVSAESTTSADFTISANAR